MRFDTAPGEQAHFDCVTSPTLTRAPQATGVGFRNGVELVRGADTARFIQCHVNVFRHFGVSEMPYDNAKVVVGRD